VVLLINKVVTSIFVGSPPHEPDIVPCLTEPTPSAVYQFASHDTYRSKVYNSKVRVRGSALIRTNLEGTSRNSHEGLMSGWSVKTPCMGNFVCSPDLSTKSRLLGLKMFASTGQRQRQGQNDNSLSTHSLDNRFPSGSVEKVNAVHHDYMDVIQRGAEHYTNEDAVSHIRTYLVFVFIGEYSDLSIPVFHHILRTGKESTF